jgi:hypothetical protein
VKTRSAVDAKEIQICVDLDISPNKRARHKEHNTKLSKNQDETREFSIKNGKYEIK